MTPTGAPDYYKTALLAGMYGTTPVLAYITDDGRFVMRLEDIPDIWGQGGQAGINELIAALTHAKRFDRRGQIVRLDDFTIERSFDASGGAGTGAANEYSDEYYYIGGYSLKMTAGSTSERVVYIIYNEALSWVTRVGFECRLFVKEHVESFVLLMSVYDNTNHHLAGVRYVVADQVWQYYNKLASWTTFLEGVNYTLPFGLFRPFKFVIDPNTDHYIRFLYQGGEVDMSDYECAAIPGAQPPLVKCYVYIYSDAGQNGVAYLDAVVITQNEPE